mgnify:CR=1 FL=1
MLKLKSQWYSLIGVACLLTACSEAPNGLGGKKNAKAVSKPSVISAMAQTKPMNRANEELKLANQIAAKKQAQKQLAQTKKVSGNEKTRRSIEATLPSRSDQYTILFDLNSNRLNDAYKGELVQFAEYLNKHPEKRVHVDGFTCELGSAEYNVALGQRRAYAVAKYLESKGVKSKQVILVSYGKERPTDPSHNELAWMKNRRVEVFF